MYEETAITRPCYFAEEKKNEFTALAAAGVVEKIFTQMAWHGDLPLLAGPVPQYGEYAVISPEKYFEGTPEEGGCPGIEFLFEVRTVNPERLQPEISRCFTALRDGGSGAGDDFAVYISDPGEGIVVKTSGIFTEFKVRFKVFALTGTMGEDNNSQHMFLPEAQPEWLFMALAGYKGLEVGNVAGIWHRCRRAELVRSEYFPLSGCQRLTLHINEVYPEGTDGEPEKEEGAWVHYPVTGGKITCLHEGVGSKVTFSQKYRSGRVWWKKSYYAEFIIDLANSEVKGVFASHAVDFQMLEKELEGIVAATMIAGKNVTGANIQEDGSGLTVRMEGTTVDGAEFSVSGLFAERVTAVKSLSLLTEALEQYGKWGIRESSVSMESASGKLCWQLYMTMLLS